MESETEQAIENLQAIKSGDDPRAEVATEDSAEPTNTYEIEEHEDVRRLFVEVLNVVRPDHPYLDDPYPVEYDHIIWSYYRSTSGIRARCGPRRMRWKVAKFYDDITYFRDVSIERALTVLVHEATHIAEGSHTDGSSHNPAFWRTYADNAIELRESLDELSTAGCVDVEQFEREIVHDPNGSMVDRRSVTVEEQKDAIRQRIEAYHVEV